MLLFPPGFFYVFYAYAEQVHLPEHFWQCQPHKCSGMLTLILKLRPML